MSSEKKTGKQRLRKTPYKKWQPQEERALVDFLKRNQSFEKPTAKQFYSKFLDETKTDIEWDLIRGKVRNMRMCYNRAKQWSESPDATSHLNKGETIRDVLQRMFNYYADFDELFGCNADDNGEEDFAMDYVKEENLSDDYQDSYTTDDMLLENVASSTFVNDESNEAAAVAVNVTKSGRYKNYLDGQHKKRRFDSDKLPFSLKVEELKLQREKLQLDRDKFNHEMALKQKELESQEKLKVLELEMKERIAMTEIKMKERVALQALEKKLE